MALTVLLYVVIPKGLFPTQDTGQLQARLETGKAVSYAKMADLQQQAARLILEDRTSARSVPWSAWTAAKQHHAAHRQHADQPEARTHRQASSRPWTACASACRRSPA